MDVALWITIAIVALNVVTLVLLVGALRLERRKRSQGADAPATVSTFDPWTLV